MTERAGPSLDSAQAHTLRGALRKDRTEEDDCLPCRVVGMLFPSRSSEVLDMQTDHQKGAGAFIGLGAYSYFSGMHQLRQRESEILKSNSFLGMKSRRLGITGLAITLVTAGAYRFVN